MKINILKHNLIKICPESDADAALLGMWEKMQARTSGAEFDNRSGSLEIRSLNIEFSPRGGTKGGQGKLAKSPNPM